MPPVDLLEGDPLVDHANPLGIQPDCTLQGSARDHAGNNARADGMSQMRCLHVADQTPPAEITAAEITAAEVFALQPGLARLMPEIGDRMWRLYHAARAANWPMAGYQLRHVVKLFQLGNVTRPKYTTDVDDYLAEALGPLREAILTEKWPAFSTAYAEAVRSGNEYHDRWKKPYIVWRCPENPPPDLDLAPRAGPGPPEPGEQL
ncbi:MAG: hypothetical protein NVSMB29_08290 [Candidatus Dormibacteria bacterium]